MQRVVAAIHMDPEHAAFRRQLDAYLEAWGFRCSSELMLTVPVVDEESIASLVRSYLEREGFNVLRAACGGEALDVLESRPVRIVVLDVGNHIKERKAPGKSTAGGPSPKATATTNA